MKWPLLLNRPESLLQKGQKSHFHTKSDRGHSWGHFWVATMIGDTFID